MKLANLEELYKNLKNIKDNVIIDLKDATDIHKNIIIAFLAGYLYDKGKIERLNKHQYKLHIQENI